MKHGNMRLENYKFSLPFDSEVDMKQRFNTAVFSHFPIFFSFGYGIFKSNC